MTAFNNHPTEDTLIAYALTKADDESIADHVDACAECSEYVRDIACTKEKISSIEDEEIPISLQNKILSISRQKKASIQIDILQHWYKHPFIMGLATAAAAVASYILFTFVY